VRVGLSFIIVCLCCSLRSGIFSSVGGDTRCVDFLFLTHISSHSFAGLFGRFCRFITQIPRVLARLWTPPPLFPKLPRGH
jgi:hypothetical protein